MPVKTGRIARSAHTALAAMHACCRACRGVPQHPLCSRRTELQLRGGCLLLPGTEQWEMTVQVAHWYGR